jgi:phospholipid/cholesterol/gamma-HCH transport system substrate-binding protein
VSTALDTPTQRRDTPRMPSGGATGRGTSASRARRLAPAALFAVAVALAAIALLGSGSSYTINARFVDAGQLVPGGLVEVAGRSIGSISDIGITDNGLANVKMSITDPSYVPLHLGTRASIRAVGLAGVTNRFVDLSPGPSYLPSMRDGAVLGTDSTRGIVDIDELLNAFTPDTRQALRELISNSAQIFAGSGSRRFNAVLAKLSPALAQTAGTTGQLAQDRAGLVRLIGTASRAAKAVANRRGDLESAVANAAQALTAIASERAALSDDLARMPAVLEQATPTLALVRSGLAALRPDLAKVPQAARPLTLVLDRLAPAAARLRPVVAQLVNLQPSLNSALNGLAPLAPVINGALGATTTALARSMHIFKGLREYGADLVIGLFTGIAGVTSPYDAVGHYVRVETMVSPRSSLSGLLGLLLGGHGNPGLSGIRTTLAPCPGGAAPPAPDHSNPWIPDRSICNPLDDHP